MKNHTKQVTFDNLPKPPTPEPAKTPKQITITQIEAEIGEDELTLKIAFKLSPSRAAFSKVKSDLLFDGQLVNSVLIRIPQGPLATDESEYSSVLDMKGIPAAIYKVTVEMYEPWDQNEKLYQITKTTTIDYVPQTRQSRFIKIPTVKRVAGADLAIISENDKDIYREIEKTIKKEHTSKRDEW
jgi:hypothetical protein